MSLVFIPKIKDKYKQRTPEGKIKVLSRKAKEWTKKDIEMLVNLRALNVPYTEVGAILRRKAETCSMKIHMNYLYGDVTAKRNEILDKLIGEYNDTETN